MLLAALENNGVICVALSLSLSLRPSDSLIRRAAVLPARQAPVTQTQAKHMVSLKFAAIVGNLLYCACASASALVVACKLSSRQSQRNPPPLPPNVARRRCKLLTVLLLPGMSQCPQRHGQRRKQRNRSSRSSSSTRAEKEEAEEAAAATLTAASSAFSCHIICVQNASCCVSCRQRDFSGICQIAQK